MYNNIIISISLFIPRLRGGEVAFPTICRKSNPKNHMTASKFVVFKQLPNRKSATGTGKFIFEFSGNFFWFWEWDDSLSRFQIFLHSLTAEMRYNHVEMYNKAKNFGNFVYIHEFYDCSAMHI